MFDLKDLYQEVIIDHNRSPRNFGKLEDATQVAEGYNPLCGDKLNLYLKTKDSVITDVSFDGSGCAISVASASLMTDTLKGKTIEQAEQLFQNFHNLIIEEEDPDLEQMQALGKLAALAGVKEYPARVKCATLCWHTLHSALQGETSPATTE
ncbi:MAG: SUF system NifU family Fe-S cluster assembly protein [Proteobacteria bacterium]|nr:SUF system NifU family Fe-S cluster assembly protein [Pseudomonadota bacterium]